jgi:cytochrome oxidase Cu insertion factor (SCO1/SenC/PrrC family)
MASMLRVPVFEDPRLEPLLDQASDATRTGPGPNDYAISHSSVLYLMGPDGEFVAPILSDETGTQIAGDLSGLMP